MQGDLGYGRVLGAGPVFSGLHGGQVLEREHMACDADPLRDLIPDPYAPDPFPALRLNACAGPAGPPACFSATSREAVLRQGGGGLLHWDGYLKLFMFCTKLYIHKYN
jgi:hypothetical protein